MNPVPYWIPLRKASTHVAQSPRSRRAGPNRHRRAGHTSRRARASEPYEQNVRDCLFSKRMLMIRNLLVFAVVPACIALHLAVLPISASGQEVSGGVGGVTRDSASNQPLAHVRITAHNVNRGTDRTAISGPDGAFAVLALEPGLYQVAAAKEGFTQSTTNVYVATPRPYRVDLLLAADTPPSPAAKTSPAPADSTMSAVEDELAALKLRIVQLEAAMHARAATPPAETAAAAPPPAPAPAPQAPESTPGVDNFT